jgi:hypothetical protein
MLQQRRPKAAKVVIVVFRHCLNAPSSGVISGVPIDSFGGPVLDFESGRYGPNGASQSLRI